MNLFDIQDSSIISKTSLSRKLTIGGITKAYPVYRVRIDQLYYNDQNDRIATWITQYKNDIGNVSFKDLTREEYNKIIEKFIIDSNPTAIEKTKKNIALVNQREPGVVLADGRIIDGNRRYTCLRLLHEEDSSVDYFETVILDNSSESNQKQIKMLELAIQHGEEQRVDYNQIDMAIGAYHDIIETELLTLEEYSSSTNEPINDVKRRLATAQLIIEFLEFMNVPKQYHIAREMQVYTLFFELMPLLKRCDTASAQEELKRSVFSNMMMGTFTDQSKYIRNVKAMMDSGLYSSYIKKQNKIAEQLEEKKAEADIHNKRDLEDFVKANEDTTEELQISMDRSLLQSKKAQTKSRPSQIVNKSLSMLMDIDTRIFDKLSDAEKDKLSSQLHKLTDAVSLIEDEVTQDNKNVETQEKHESKENDTNNERKIALAPINREFPYIFCANSDLVVTNLSFSLLFGACKYIPSQKNEATCLIYIVDENNEILCPVQEVTVSVGTQSKVNFALNSSASSKKECFVIIKYNEDISNHAQSMTRLKINITFAVDFDF
jgi:ParB-like chromosome segregation protein Spo0J